MDIFIQPNEDNAKRVYKALLKFGAPLQNIAVEDFSNSGTIFQIGVIPRRIDIINSIDGVTFEDAYNDKVIVEIESMSIPVLSKDHMIKNKNSTGRAKDKVDAETLENS